MFNKYLPSASSVLDIIIDISGTEFCLGELGSVNSIRISSLSVSLGFITHHFLGHFGFAFLFLWLWHHTHVQANQVATKASVLYFCRFQPAQKEQQVFIKDLEKFLRVTVIGQARIMSQFLNNQ